VNGVIAYFGSGPLSNAGIRVESELGKGTLFEIYFPVIMEKVGEE
jgi:hypothetical protein